MKNDQKKPALDLNLRRLRKQVRTNMNTGITAPGTKNCCGQLGTCDFTGRP